MTVSRYLARLVSDAVSIQGVPDFADAITGYFHRREAMSIGDDAHLAGVKAEDELEFIDRIKECRDKLTAIVSAIESRNDPQDSFADMVDDTLDRTNDAVRGATPVGIDPGIPEITTLTGPWQKKQLLIIGGGVKQGKSALAMQCMFNIAEKAPVGLNSGEMSRMQIIMREKARRTGISSTRQQRGSVSDNEVEELFRAGEAMKRLKYIDIDCRRLTLDQIDQKIARLIGEHGIEAFFLDHIGKIQWTGKMEYEDEFKQGQRATSILKDFAQKHDIPIIALIHLKKSTFLDYQGRSFKERLSAAMNRRPTYRDIVGNMDKDADQVLIVFQARAIVAGMEPAEKSDDYPVWEDAMNRVAGKADIILSLSRESEFPRRKEIEWDGKSTSYGPAFRQAMDERTLL
ncbi:DnaB-like helicase C-terminal domain-containing protein [Neorhizobium huautlense]|uniref:DnaB-like helicase C-terminal domain-containing protein n=1 Tax=Neorhizobium huautlense TaxID=67774 RepID=UPI001300BAF8|nr:DnaB-like helicase C-terminal domain-containing protein [Neorhizobium huautlense]